MKPSEIAENQILGRVYGDEAYTVLARAYLWLLEAARNVEENAHPTNGTREWIVGCNYLGELADALEEEEFPYE